MVNRAEELAALSALNAKAVTDGQENGAESYDCRGAQGNQDHEYRVALLPSAAYQLIKRGHECGGAWRGRGRGLSDADHETGRRGHDAGPSRDIRDGREVAEEFEEGAVGFLKYQTSLSSRMGEQSGRK